MHIEKETFLESKIKLRHDLRQSKTYKNNDINPALTKNNYYFGNWDPFEKFEKRINEIYVYGKNGKNKDKINYLCSIVIQYPDNCPVDEFTFFKQCTSILAHRFGAENVISAMVHKDEKGKTHMHFKFIPVVKMNKPKNGYTEKLCAKDVVNREMLLTFHQDIENDFLKYYGEKISLRNKEHEHRKYVNDIYEFKELQDERAKLQEEIEITKQDLNTNKQELAETQKQLVELYTAYKELEDQHNQMADAFNNLQEMLDKVRNYFNKYYRAMLPALEEEAKRELQKLDKDLNEKER